MRIGIDIDGVLTDCERFMIDYGSKYCVENSLPIDIKLGEYDDTKMFNCSEEDAMGFWKTYVIEYFENYKIRDFAADVINKLKQEGHEIYIITARNEYGVPIEYREKIKEITEKWLAKNNVPYDKIIYSEGSKLPYCVGNYIEVMIEDSPRNIVEISSKIPVISYNNYWNEKIEGENIIKVHSWYEVYNKIKNIK